MTIPAYVSRPAALAVGIAAVCAASLYVPQPLFRTFLVWLSVMPVLWAVRPVESAPKPAPAGRVRRSGEPRVLEIEAFEEPALHLEEPARRTPAAPPARAAKEARAAQRSPGTKSSRPAVRKIETVTVHPEGNPRFPMQRRFHMLRRLTEQYLREVRRMNLVAMWGREGSIPRQQAIAEIREIEGRMCGLSERMKLAAGRVK